MTQTVIPRRELVVAVISICGTIAIFAATESSAPAIMGLSVFDWNKIEATLDEPECHVTTLNPGVASYPAHKHPNEELVIIREGTVEVLVNGELKRVGPGSVVFNASNVMHSLRTVGDTPAVYHVINGSSPGMKPKVTQ